MKAVVSALVRGQGYFFAENPVPFRRHEFLKPAAMVKGQFPKIYPGLDDVKVNPDKGRTSRFLCQLFRQV